MAKVVKYLAWYTTPKSKRKYSTFNSLNWLKTCMRSTGEYNLVLHELPDNTIDQRSLRYQYPDSDEFIADPTKQQTNDEYVVYSLRKRGSVYNLQTPFESRAPLEQLRCPLKQEQLIKASIAAEQQPAPVATGPRIKNPNLDNILDRLKKERSDVHALLDAVKE
jgi:hypothetical protein